MKTDITKRLGVWAVVVAGILMIPFLTQAPWTKGDFIYAGAALFALATIYEITTRNMKNVNQKIIIAAALLGFIVLIIGWAATGPD